MPARILEGDCLNILPTLPDNSIDAIVTDPPYHLASAQAMSVKFNHKRNGDGSDRTHQPNYAKRGFMNSEWDGGDIAFRTEVWEQCLRVLKPGGYMVAFGGTRTYHRLATAIEDAGFILHPMLVWAFGQGFPKAASASKAIDKHLGAAPVINYKTAPATPEAAQWEGWAYGLQSLKPALEPICMAQKPMIGTGAENILEWGVGAVNIDGCRVPSETWIFAHSDKTSRSSGIMGNISSARTGIAESHPAGRWPPNLLTDGSEEVTECFPHSKSTSQPRHNTPEGVNKEHSYGRSKEPWITGGFDDEGSAARFFPALGYSDDERRQTRLRYQAKANKRDRAGSKHPTIKPIKLIEWLCKLITPPGGTILDPFAGSGTTGAAASNLGFNSILIEKEAEYVEDIRRRLAMFLEAHPAHVSA